MVVVCILVLGIWRSLLRGRFPARAAPLYLVLAVDDFALDYYQRKVDSALGSATDTATQGGRRRQLSLHCRLMIRIVSIVALAIVVTPRPD